MGRNAIITAIPRSGSSLFVKMLNDIPDCVALNEISVTPYPHLFFSRMRKRIRSRQPVPNKYSPDGKLTTNTIDTATRFEEYVIPVESDDFVLAHKYTTPYLNRIEGLVEDHWQVWVLVRHPLYTLASWKRCPPNFTITQLNPPHASLAHIPFSSDNLDVRRVEVWNHFAHRIHRLKDRIQIIRYEDLIEDIQGVMNRFIKHYGLRQTQFEALESRNRSDAYKDLSHDFRRIVAERCDGHLFGYKSAFIN